jgi:hypothetical protein
MLAVRNSVAIIIMFNGLRFVRNFIVMRFSCQYFTFQDAAFARIVRNSCFRILLLLSYKILAENRLGN